MELPIVLIGPMCSGKSTIAQLVAQRLGIPRYELDALRGGYYQAGGFDADLSSDIGAREGTSAMVRYWKPFEVYAVERVMAEHSDGVIDFGAGNSVQDDPALFERVRRALVNVPVVLLLPSPDPDEAIRVLNRRLADALAAEMGSIDPEVLDINAQLVRHPANFELATYVLYTNDKTPQETCTELISACG